MTPQELKAARGSRTQHAQAALMGVSTPALRNWEQGVSPIPPYVPAILRGLAAPDKPAATPTWHIIAIYRTPFRIELRADKFGNAFSADTQAFNDYRGAERFTHEPTQTVYVLL